VWILLTGVLGLGLAACGASEPGAGDGPTASTVADDHGDEEVEDDHAEEEADFWFGAPADPTDADRVIEIEAKDDFSFAPAEISVAVGETVTFRISNTGILPHDFTIGDEAMQAEHEEEMSGGEMHGGADPNAVFLEPGETKELTFAFMDAGSLIVGCHVPGHYAAGMWAPLTVES
jgi:uncharacterized cupredoxin-like copper-binding protein